jgi:glucose-6-phosphate isomerase
MILELQVAFSTKKIPFEKHFIAVTMQGSPMEKVAREENWLNVFPTWDWVGGRVSVFSSVGLLPLALLGISINDLLFGAREMDKITRNKTVINNPAMLLSVAWKYFKEERKITTMVTLPYKDRLSFFSRYLQQLVMESLGKNKTRQGEKTCTGLTVYGNKGSTDQHAYVQQLREGICDFFTLFLLVKKDRDNIAPIVNHSTITTGDYLWAFCLGTQKALFEKNRESILLTMDKISPTVIGALIALFERAVGFYAYMLNVNAYNQPGVEAGKICAEDIISLQEKINIFLSQKKYIELTVEEIAQSIGSDDLRLVSYLVEHYRANH